MTQILVVYFSRTGFTQTIARQIARACKADLESIDDTTLRSQVTGFVGSALEAVLHLEPPIQPTRHAPGDYDIIVLGSPVWCWNMASPVRTYIKQHQHQFKQVAFFCTFGGSGQLKVLRDLDRLCKRHAVATLAVADWHHTGPRYYDRLSKFATLLTGGLHQPIKPMLTG
jgi:flavodoxin